MVMGYTLYSHDNNGRLLPGYLSIALLNNDVYFGKLKISLGGGSELADADKQSYVWRLAPYVDDSWQTFFEEADAGAMAGFSAEYQRMENQSHTPGSISEHPSFGLNSIFVGGDSAHGGVGNHNPWNGSEPEKAATRLSHVVNPTQLIVFAPTAEAAVAADDVYANDWVGFCELRAPFLDRPDDSWQNQQWAIGANGRIVQTGSFSEGGGLPIARTAKEILYGGKEQMPVVHLDASTAVQLIAELWRNPDAEDAVETVPYIMRRWSQRRDVR